MPNAAEFLEVIESSYPDLWVRTYTLNDSGQNNYALIVNDEIIFRFPRHIWAARRLQTEVAILGRVQDRVTLPVPNPVYLSLGPAADQPSGAPSEGTGGRPTRRGRGGRRAGGAARGTAPVSLAAISGGAPVPAVPTPVSRAVPAEAAEPPPTAAGPAPTVTESEAVVRPLHFSQAYLGFLPWRARGRRGRRAAGGAVNARAGNPAAIDLIGGAAAPAPPVPPPSEDELRRRAAEEALLRRIFVGYHLIPGESLWRERFLAVDEERIVQNWADQLGTFLRELHATPISGQLASLLQTADGRTRWERFYERVREKVYPHMRPEARRRVTVEFEAFLGERGSFTYEPVLVHGDFGPTNILHDAQSRRISGVIDFGGAGLDDPAVDLAALMGPFGYGETFVRRLLRSYPLPEAALARARFYAGTFALQDALFGLETGDQEAFAAGIRPYA